MNATVSLEDVVLRLLAATLAGALIGFDRGRRGRVAGIRTTILLCVAACGAMIEANLTLGAVGKTNESFSMMDALRFPLGILTGIGFIGAGAILKKGSIVSGVTTASTVWLVTVIGLVLGGGYFFLGSALVLIALITLMGIVHLEPLIARDHHATLIVALRKDGDGRDDIRREIEAAGYRITFLATTIRRDVMNLRASLAWRARKGPVETPTLVASLSERDSVLAVIWEPEDSDEHNDR